MCHLLVFLVDEVDEDDASTILAVQADEIFRVPPLLEKITQRQKKRGAKAILVGNEGWRLDSTTTCGYLYKMVKEWPGEGTLGKRSGGATLMRAESKGYDGSHNRVCIFFYMEHARTRYVRGGAVYSLCGLRSQCKLRTRTNKH